LSFLRPFPSGERGEKGLCGNHRTRRSYCRRIALPKHFFPGIPHPLGVMNAPGCSRFERMISAQRAGMLKMATDQQCECCGCRIPPSLLEVHCIPGAGVREREEDPFMHILLLCPACHGSMHRCNVPEREQRLLVGSRTTELESRIKKALSRKAYVPPPSPDPEELFASALSSGGIDLFLNGA
jgi:hypothetical protein